MKNIRTKSNALACIIIVCILASMSLLLPSVTEAGEPLLIAVKPFKSHGSLSVTGTASIECRPNQMTIILRIKAEDPNSVEKAADQVAVMIDKLLDSLQKLGISKDDVETTSYNINQKYKNEYDEKGNFVRSVFDGYEVVNTIKITLKDFDKAGKVIDATAEVGGLVDSVNFELSSEKRNELKIQVMTKAAEDARIKAEAVISALEEEIGNVTSVSLNDYYYQPYNYWNRAELECSGIRSDKIIPPTTILPSDLTVSANINVVFDIV
jgi:uncharacterized protein YggE